MPFVFLEVDPLLAINQTNDGLESITLHRYQFLEEGT